MSTELMVAILGLIGVVVTAVVGAVIAWLSKSKSVVHRHEGSVVHRHVGSVGVEPSVGKNAGEADEFAPPNLRAETVAPSRTLPLPTPVSESVPVLDTTRKRTQDTDIEADCLRHILKEEARTSKSASLTGLINQTTSQPFYKDGFPRIEIQISTRDPKNCLRWVEGVNCAVTLLVNGSEYKASLRSRPNSREHVYFLTVDSSHETVKLTHLLTPRFRAGDDIEIEMTGSVFTIKEPAHPKAV